MKKNLMSVLILAFVVADFVLTAILMFAVIPETQKANDLIDKVCMAIDLELSSGGASGGMNIPMDQIETFVLADGETMTVNLASSGDGKSHYAVVAVSLSLNVESEGYKSTYKPEGLTARATIIQNDIIEIVGKYTKEEFDTEREKIKEEILKKLQKNFGADFIVGVNFSKATSE